MIRYMEKRDIPAMRKKMRAFYDSPAVAIHCTDEVLEQNLKAAMDPSSLLDCLVSEENGEVVGYVFASRGYVTEYGGECIWLEEICIDPEWRGKGLGTAFFEWVKRHYPKAVVFRLEAEPDNRRAISLYERWGFSLSPYIHMNCETNDR